MATDTTICNQALDALGKAHLTSLGVDGTYEDDLCNAAYAEVRDEVLRTHPWNVGVKRIVLAENLLTYSEDFSNAAWTKTNASAASNALPPPFGDGTVYLLTDSDGVNAGTVADSVTVPNDSKNHTFPIYLYQGTASVTRILIAYTGGTGVSQAVDITWGATPSISAGTIEDAGGGFWRVWVTLVNNASGNTTLTVTIYPAGATGSATGTVYAFAAQVSQSDAAIGYGVTAGTASILIHPQFGYGHGHLLPTDFIALVDVNEGDLNYKLENDYLLYDSTDVPIRYQFQQTDADKLDPLLQSIIALRLAKRLAIPLGGSDDRKKDIARDLKKAESEAKTRDAQEDGEDAPVEDSWIAARGSGSSGSYGRW